MKNVTFKIFFSPCKMLFFGFKVRFRVFKVAKKGQIFQLSVPIGVDNGVRDSNKLLNHEDTVRPLVPRFLGSGKISVARKSVHTL